MPRTCDAEVPLRKTAKYRWAMKDDPFGERPPTSHERTTGRPWNDSYRDGPAPWDIGGPQPAIVRAAGESGLGGTILDAGCGSGENALYLASLGATVIGVDVAETALSIARSRATERGLNVSFVAEDAFSLTRLGRTFSGAIDCGLFHTFNGEERRRYVASLAGAIERGGILVLLCFRDEGRDSGPHPVREDELRAAFTPEAGWTIRSIERERVRTRFHDEHGAPAWLARIERI
jgi:SAM-dependent methyltransferase